MNGFAIGLSDLNFNPRAPRGARPENLEKFDLVYKFQSTRSARSATRWRTRVSNKYTKFQSTRSARSATISLCDGQAPAGNFNPRAPRGARPCQTQTSMSVLPFQSTRSARSATSPGICVRFEWVGFQSTRSARSATGAREYIHDRRRISIHALREERDCMLLAAHFAQLRFQSTRSARSATKQS